VQRVIWVVGNEPIGYIKNDARSDPALVIPEAVKAGFILSVIDCNYGQYESATPEWKHMAEMGGGRYLRLFGPGELPQAVVQGLTPYDAKIDELNRQLNATYLPYGKLGVVAWKQQLLLDTMARQSGSNAFVQRVQSKLQPNYDQSSWDFVDATRPQNFELPPGLTRQDLPPALWGLSPLERVAYLRMLDKNRVALRDQIQKVLALRQVWAARFLMIHFLNPGAAAYPNNAQPVAPTDATGYASNEIQDSQPPGRGSTRSNNRTQNQSSRRRSLPNSSGAANHASGTAPDITASNATAPATTTDGTASSAGTSTSDAAPNPVADGATVTGQTQPTGDAAETARLAAVTLSVDAQLPDLTAMQKDDIRFGRELGRQLLEKMTSEERLKVLWMLKVTPSLRRLIVEKKQAVQAASSLKNPAAPKDATTPKRRGYNYRGRVAN